MSDDDLESRLAAWVGDRLGIPGVTLVEFQRHAEGFSWETYTFTAVPPGPRTSGRHGLAVRREPLAGTLERYDAAMDFRLLQALSAVPGIPIAEPLWLEQDAAVLDRPFYAMRRVQGTVPVPWATREWALFGSEATRTALGRQFVAILARIHRLDPVVTGIEFLGRPASPEAQALGAVARWERMYELAGFPEVALMREAFRWLRANLAVSGRITLVHGDFRIGNFMIDAAGTINAVFDWELAHLGDPVFDIAYSALRLYRGRSPLFSQLLERDAYLDLYRELTGLEVTDAAFRFWTVLGYVRALAQHFRKAPDNRHERRE